MIKNNEALTEITKYNITLLRNKGFIDKNINIGDIASIDVSKIPSKSHYKVIAICEICNTEKELPYHKYTRNHNNCGFYTCNTCAIIKRKKTSLEKYGVEFPAQRIELKEKQKEWMSSEEFKEKSTKTQIDKYGCRYTQTDESKKNISIKTKKIIQDKKDKGIYNTSLSLPENKELREKGMYEKYGHTYSFHVESIRNKIQEGNLEKFGHISPFGNYDVSNKAKLTLKNKYGVDNPFKSKEIQDRIQLKLKEMYYDLYTNTENLSSSR